MTSFGKYLRKLRIDKNELLYDMAQKLSVSPSFLSSVEHGKKSIPSEWPDKIRQLYNLESIAVSEMKRAADESAKQIQIDLGDASADQRSLASVFARRFSNLNQEDLDEFRRLLSKAEDKGKR